jgi:HlyD family secretion protein
MLQRADVAEVLKVEAERSHRGRTVRIVVVVLIVALVLVAGVALWSFFRIGTPVRYATAPVTRADISVVLTATGTLEPTQQVAVSSLVTGTVASVDVDYNQPVKRGQVLARLDLREFDLRLTRAVAVVDAQKAARDVARAGVTDAEATLRRTGELAVGELVSIEKVEFATTALQRAKANLAAAEAQLKASEADLAGARDDYSKAIIVSPIDGIMLDLSVEVGQTINATALGTSLFTIASDLRRLDLEVDVDEADISQVKVGDTAAFTVEAMPDRPLTGVVRQVRTGPTISDGITSYKAVIAVDNEQLSLRPGMTSTADITTAEAAGVLTVPNGALRFEPDTPAPTADAAVPHVYVLRENTPVLVPVATGLTDGQRTEVTSGNLTLDDLVVLGTAAR